MYSLDGINVVALCIINALSALSGIFLNFLVILSFWTSSQLRRKLCYFLILVLASVDLFVITIVHPLIILASIAKYTRKTYGVFNEIGKHSIDILSGFSLFSLLTMNIERYLAKVHPFFYQRSVTRRRLLTIVATFWLFVIAQWLLSFYTKISKEGAAVAIIGLAFFVMSSVKYKIFVVARKMQLNDASLSRNIAPTDEMELAARCTSNNQTAHKRKKLADDLKNISTCILVVACFIVCVCPTAIFCGLYTFQNESVDEDSLK